MNKILLFLLLGTAPGWAAPLTCPEAQFNPIGGLYVGMPFSELKSKFPGIYSLDKYLIKVNEVVLHAPKEFSDVRAELAPTRAYVGTITFYLTNELDWGYERMFKRAINDYRLPKEGWQQLDKHSHQLQCAGYEISMGIDKELGFFMRFHMPEVKKKRR